jgi:hypothetical protein
VIEEARIKKTIAPNDLASRLSAVTCRCALQPHCAVGAAGLCGGTPGMSLKPRCGSTPKGRRALGLLLRE